MGEPLEPELLRALTRSGDMGLTVQKLAEILGARACHVSKVCGRLARAGTIIRTMDGDEHGRGPYYRIVGPVDTKDAPPTEVCIAVDLKPTVTVTTPHSTTRPVEIMEMVEDLVQTHGYRLTSCRIEELPDTAGEATHPEVWLTLVGPPRVVV